MERLCEKSIAEVLDGLIKLVKPLVKPELDFIKLFLEVIGCSRVGITSKKKKGVICEKGSFF